MYIDDASFGARSLYMDEQNQPQPAFTDKDLYGDSGRPQPQDIAQLQLGDCYFISPLGSLAHQQPERIQDAIKYDSTTQNFTVTMYQQSHGGFLGMHSEAKPVQIQVSQSDIQKDIAIGGDSLIGRHPGVKEPAWPAVMEVAYAKLSEKKDETLTQGFDNISHGGYSKDVLYSLTGEKAQTLSASSLSEMKLDDAYKQIDADLKAGRPVLLSTNPMPENMNDNLVRGDRGGGHSYMVEGISKGQDGNVSLSLRNPWGHNVAPDMGVNIKDPTVSVDLNTILKNGHLQGIDVGAKSLQLDKNQDQNKETQKEQTPALQYKTGDPAFDKLLGSLENQDSTTKALQELAQSPSGQAFHAQGQAQVAEFQNQQLQAQVAQQQTQIQNQPQQVQAGPVMTR
jgi:hypothetical protein